MLTLTTSIETEQYFRDNWKPNTLQKKELLYAIYLNDKMQPELIKCLFQGNYSKCEFYFKDAIQYAWAIECNNVILAHNHPSGEVEPSVDDLNTTKEIYLTMCKLGIVLVDSFIITHHDGYFSFKESGIMDSYHECCLLMKSA